MRTTISREGLYYVVVIGLLFAGAMLRQVNLLLALAGMLVGPLLLGWRLAVRSLRGLRVERKLPAQIAAGDVLAATIVLENPRRRLGCWAVVVEDQLRRETAGRPERPLRTQSLFPYVPAGQQRKAVCRSTAPQRGRYQFGPLRVSTRFPFGLFCRRETIAQSHSLTVLPRLGRLKPMWAMRRRQAFVGAQRRGDRPGPEGEFFGLRPWRSGDSQRWIHWRTSARCRQPMVRQLEQPRNRDLALVLDLWQPARPGPSQADNVELAVSFAATVAAEQCRRGGSTLHLAVFNGQPQIISGPATAALLHDLLQRLALVEAGPTDVAAALLTHTLREVEPGTEIVLVGTRPVDWADPSRWADVHAPRPFAAWQEHVRCVDASSDELFKYFEIE